MIDPQVQKIIQDMVTTQSQIASRMQSDQQRPWMNFENVQEVGKFDFAGLHELFNRSAASDDYSVGRQQPDTKASQLQTAKISTDLLAALERDQRCRMRSRVRRLVHGQVTVPKSNGSQSGPLQRNTIDWMTRILGEKGE